MKPKVIITAYAHVCLQEALLHRGFDVDVREKITHEELCTLAASYTGMVVTTRIQVDKQLLDAASKLKWIGRLGSGMEIIDVDYANQKGILCVGSPEGNKDAVAEHCLGTLLSLMRNLPLANSHKWWRSVSCSPQTCGKCKRPCSMARITRLV